MTSFPQLRGSWPRVVILVIILGFVLVMTELGVSADAAGIAALTLAVAMPAAAGDATDAEA